LDNEATADAESLIGWLDRELVAPVGQALLSKEQPVEAPVDARRATARGTRGDLRPTRDVGTHARASALAQPHLRALSTLMSRIGALREFWRLNATFGPVCPGHQLGRAAALNQARPAVGGDWRCRQCWRQDRTPQKKSSHKSMLSHCFYPSLFGTNARFLELCIADAVERR